VEADEVGSGGECGTEEVARGDSAEKVAEDRARHCKGPAQRDDIGWVDGHSDAEGNDASSIEARGQDER
jgi:hypothetical protein